jgi:hypothetical protein
VFISSTLPEDHKKLKRKIYDTEKMFRKLDLFPSSGASVETPVIKVAAFERNQRMSASHPFICGRKQFQFPKRVFFRIPHGQVQKLSNPEYSFQITILQMRFH